MANNDELRHSGIFTQNSLLTLNGFTVVFYYQLVGALFAGIVLHRDGTIAVVLDNRFVYLTTWHFDFS